MNKLGFLFCFGAAALAAGCGSSQDTSVPLGTSQVATIGVIAPLNSGLTAFGRGIRNSVQLAVAQANAANAIPGWQLQVEAEDDGSDPTNGAPDATALVQNSTVIGVVGTYNSGVAATALPVLSAAALALVSPANTDPSLTQGSNPAAPVRPYSDYFRLVVPDTVQGPALADYAFTTLGLTRAAVVTETKSVSQTLANNFAARFTALGGTIVDTEVVADGTTDFSAPLTRVVAASPQLLFYGGEYDGAADLRQQASADNLTVPLMGGDGVESPSYVAEAGAVSEGDYASSVGAPTASLAGGPAFLTAYSQVGYADPPSDFGPYAYDAANLIIQSAKATLTADGLTPSTRATVVANLQSTNTSGVTGPISFDAFGDTTHKVVTIYKVVGGEFQPQETLTQ